MKIKKHAIDHPNGSMKKLRGKFKKYWEQINVGDTGKAELSRKLIAI